MRGAKCGKPTKSRSYGKFVNCGKIVIGRMTRRESLTQRRRGAKKIVANRFHHEGTKATKEEEDELEVKLSDLIKCVSGGGDEIAELRMVLFSGRRFYAAGCVDCGRANCRDPGGNVRRHQTAGEYQWYFAE
jgi:hypothetical protein